jgi:hypothetical protein
MNVEFRSLKILFYVVWKNEKNVKSRILPSYACPNLQLLGMFYAGQSVDRETLIPDKSNDSVS